MKIYASRNLRYKHFKFLLGFIYAEEEDLKILKKMPIEYGEIKDRDGNVINKPKIRRHKDVLSIKHTRK